MNVVEVSRLLEADPNTRRVRVLARVPGAYPPLKAAEPARSNPHENGFPVDAEIGGESERDTKTKRDRERKRSCLMGHTELWKPRK
jgi:hypothetical protein